MRRFVSIFLALALTLGAREAVAKSDKKNKNAQGTPADGSSPPPKFDVPIPIGHKAEGVTLPYFDDKGKLQMNFKIESAKRIDNDHLQMGQVNIETFDDEGKSDMKIDMPTSTLDLNTRIVTSETPVVIRRSDFELHGETVRFNTITRAGEMIGKVRMIIYNASEFSGDKK